MPFKKTKVKLKNIDIFSVESLGGSMTLEKASGLSTTGHHQLIISLEAKRGFAHPVLLIRKRLTKSPTCRGRGHSRNMGVDGSLPRAIPYTYRIFYH